MVSNRSKRPEGLQVPVPKFPLSSPISEEIESPSCSSAEDKDLERTRPFDFLVKATRQKVESRQAQAHAQAQIRDGRSSREISGSGSRLSIRGITKKKKNAAKPVGLNLVTDFTLSEPPVQYRENEVGNAPMAFVDLNDLKQLSRARGKERTAQKKHGPFQSRNPFLKETSQVQPEQQQQQLERQNDSPQETINPFLDPNLQDPFSDRSEHGLSPSDRHVMIGLTVPYAVSYRPKDSDGLGDQHTPLTPSIIVTPAREDAPWSTPSPETLRPRATSSVYSQPTPRGWEHEDVPPVPAIPEQHKNGMGSNFLKAHFNAMTRKHRSMSADTIFEDADVHSTERSHRNSHTSIDDIDQVPLASRLSVNTTATRPESQGWWTYLLSPLLGKKSPISPNFPRDGITSPSSKGTKEWWEEKESSHFSPDTPQTAVINWDDGPKIPAQGQARSLDDEQTTIIQKRQTILSTMFPNGRIQGEAAEYYQACAHELFSKTPFFECVDHICSITPPGAISTPIDDCPGETRDRGLIFAEAHGANEEEAKKSMGGVAGSVAGTKGLLIDIDSPDLSTKPHEHSKEIGASSPASSSSSDSWDTSLVDDNEKDVPEPPKDTSRGVPETTPAPQPIHPQEVQPPEPVQPPPQAPIYQPPAAEPAPPQPVPPPQIPPAQPQIIHNYYGAPQEPAVMQPQPQPQPAPHYIPVFPPQNGIPPPQEPRPQTNAEVSDWPKAAPAPPLTTDRSLGQEGSQAHIEDQPHANEPISPGFQRAAGGPGAIQLSQVNPNSRGHSEEDHDINAPAPAYSQYPREEYRETPLPPRYDQHPAPRAAIMDPTGPVGPIETRRRRLEREDAAGRKVGGLWRGRGCISNKGCFGRSGREGRLRRRWYLGICTLFLIIIIVAIVLATTLTKKGDDTPVQSNWLNLTGYPPMPTGISTIAGTETQDSTSTCIQPSELWSCALPKDQQSENKPYKANEPTFRIQILFRNGTYDNSTAVTKSRRGNIDWTPSPAVPNSSDQAFIGNTTDGNSSPYAGEETPFYITILSPVHLSSTNIYRRTNTKSSNETGIIASNLTDIFPPPEEISDGTAAPAKLYPLPSSQPIRLYNRDKENEHYGFYTYFDKSIFSSSRSALDSQTKDSDSNDKMGGSTKDDARVRCTWSQTRFLVQIWTKPERLGQSLLSRGTSSSTGSKTSSSATATSTSSTATSSSSATDYIRPGSFPYPVSITVDRHGGDEMKKLVYCYAVDGGKYNITDKMLLVENRGVGGTLVNPVQGGSGSKSDEYGGIDGGSGGCGCQWVNWISTS